MNLLVVKQGLTTTRRRSSGLGQHFVVYVPNRPQGPVDASTSAGSFAEEHGPPEQDALEPRPGSDNYPSDTSSADVIPLLDALAARLTDTCDVDAQTSQTTYVGRSSTANLFRALSSFTTQELLPADISIESAFGLTNRTPLHPFGSLWSTVDVRLLDILQTLTHPQDCMR